MNDLTLPSGSPFDTIRRTRPDGSEYWSARDLMPLMGYARWEDFAKITERASTSARNSGSDQGFSAITENLPGGTKPRANYHLSRFAAYLVAMNGDPNKPEVAAAQGYFAIKTYEAETAKPVNLEAITRADLARMVLEAEEEKSVLSAALDSAAPAIAHFDRFVTDTDVLTVKTFAIEFGATEREVRDLLVSRGLCYRLSLGTRWSDQKGKPVEEFEWRPRIGSTHKRSHWFDLRPQNNAPRHHNGQVRQTLYIRQQHATELAELLRLTMPKLQVEINPQEEM